MLTLATLMAGTALAADSPPPSTAAVSTSSGEAGGGPGLKLPAGCDLNTPLTLLACARLALALNPALAVADRRVAQANASATQARAALLPNLSLGAGLSASRALRSAGTSTTSTTSTTTRNTTRDLSLQLNQTFYESGLPQQIAAAQASARAALWGFNDSRRTLLLDVAQSYFNALAAMALADVTHQAVEASTLHLDAANARIEAGTAAKSDRYPFEVELQQALVQAISAENQITLSMNALKGVLGLPATAPLKLAEALGQPSPPKKAEGLLAQAMEERPDVAQRREQVEAALQLVRVAQIRRGPVVTASGSDNYGFHTKVDGNAWQVQLGVSLPIFDAGATKAAADSARAALQIAEQNLRQTQLAVSAEVENSFATALQANKQIDVTQAALTAAQVNSQAARERYRAGLGTVIDVTDAELKLQQAQTDQVHALYSYNIALAALRASVGEAAVEGVEP